jgi:hypothetical protein
MRLYKNNFRIGFLHCAENIPANLYSKFCSIRIATKSLMNFSKLLIFKKSLSSKDGLVEQPDSTVKYYDINFYAKKAAMC